MGLTNAFLYDGDGIRVEKTDSRGTSVFVYDGDTCIAEAAPNGAIRTFYTPGVGFVSPGVVTGSTLQTGFWQADGLGSTQSVADNRAQVQSGYLYDAFGATSVLLQSKATNRSRAIVTPLCVFPTYTQRTPVAARTALPAPASGVASADPSHPF